LPSTKARTATGGVCYLPMGGWMRFPSFQACAVRVVAGAENNHLTAVHKPDASTYGSPRPATKLAMANNRERHPCRGTLMLRRGALAPWQGGGHSGILQ